MSVRDAQEPSLRSIVEWSKSSSRPPHQVNPEPLLLALPQVTLESFADQRTEEPTLKPFACDIFTAREEFRTEFVSVTVGWEYLP